MHLAGLPQLAGYEFTIARWDALAGGALLALMVSEESGRAWLSRWMGHVGTASIVALAAFVIVERDFHESSTAVEVVGQSITVMLFSWLLYLGVAPTTRSALFVGRALSTRALRFLGKYSYAIYVFHYPIHAVAAHYLHNAINGADTPWRMLRWALYVASVFALSVAAALGSWHLLERRFLAMRERLAPQGSSYATAA
jgi:peptidoglycan/LPS O-acetylase OafA/YrhL